MYGLTIFKSIKDNRTHKWMSFDSLEKFEELLYRLSKQPGYKPKKDENKLGSPLICPASFQPNSKRRNVNVIQWNRWAALDVDEYDTSFEEAVSLFRDKYFICYSSASSTREHPKFRIVFPLTHDVPSDKIKHFWFALNTEYNSIGDKQTKDLSRMYYVPAQYPGAYNFIFTNKNNFINPNELMEKHEYVSDFRQSFSDKMPQHIQEKLDAFRRDQLTNNSIHWSSYHDCPFVDKNRILEFKATAHIDGSGRYAKMYSLMVSIAANAIRLRYPITSSQIETICREIDSETGGRYRHRPFRLEAERAISFALSG